MSFKEIVGHERPRAILKRAIANETLAHAYLFSGGEGIGKRMTALAVAAAVNCERPDEDGGCGVCGACRKIAVFSHPELHIVQADRTEIKIDQIRQVQADLSLRPFEGAKKVLIVDGAETMNAASANAFLKTLEEPPGDSLIILITSMPQSLPLTIRSRCQEIKFPMLPRQTLAQALARMRDVPAGDAWFLATLARGSLGRALAMDVASEKRKREEFATFWMQLQNMDHDEVLAQAEAYAKDRDRFEDFYEFGREWLRDVLVYHATGDEKLLIHGDEPERLRTWSERFPVQRLLTDIHLLKQSRQLLDRRVSAQLVAEHLFFQLGRS